MPGNFFDTNVLLYVGGADRRKAEEAEGLLRQGGTISVQVLNEFANVSRRKARLPWPELHSCLRTIRRGLAVLPLTVEIHQLGVQVAERYSLSIYDAMIVASALDANCDTLWSEDMQHHLLIDRLRIRNPFS